MDVGNVNIVWRVLALYFENEYIIYRVLTLDYWGECASGFQINRLYALRDPTFSVSKMKEQILLRAFTFPRTLLLFLYIYTFIPSCN